MKIFLTVVLTIIVLCLLGLIFMYSGIFNVSILEPSSGFTRWVLNTTMEHSIESRAEEIDPPDLSDPEMVREGAAHYAQMCAGCHSTPGKELNEMAKGMEPQPPLLYKMDEVGDEAAAEAFWIIKHGIMFTGMPAWGATHSDDKIWNIVAFLQELPRMSAQEYQAMTASASHMEEDEHSEPEGEQHEH
ncbi:MAG: cytochrome c [Calditrichia bacterium]